MTGDYEQAGSAVPSTLSRLHELLETAAVEHPEVAEDDFHMLEIAVIELAGNLVRHGGPAGEVDYRFRLDVLPDRLVAVLVDSGDPAPADAAAPRDMPDPTEESGRGIPMAHAALDHVDYQRVNGHNEWRLTRTLRPPAPERG